MLTYSPPLVEADVERELDDQRHELFRNEVRKFRHEGREEFCAVRFFVGFPAARGLDFPQVGVRAMPGVILKDICCMPRRGRRRAATIPARPRLTRRRRGAHKLLATDSPETVAHLRCNTTVTH